MDIRENQKIVRVVLHHVEKFVYTFIDILGKIRLYYSRLIQSKACVYKDNVGRDLQYRMGSLCMYVDCLLLFVGMGKGQIVFPQCDKWRTTYVPI